MKILVVIGTRPEAIKMAPVIQALLNVDNVELKVCVTAQHRQMLDKVLNLFDITPDFDLDLMRPDQDLTDITSKILLGMRNIFRGWRPDWVLVHGDTTTAISAALAAYYEKIKVGHVEAGLRTGNIYSPWPEEANRCMVAVLASMHFAPTLNAKQNLLHEGVQEKSILVTGNTVIDALLDVVGRIRQDSEFIKEMKQRFISLDNNKKLILVTGHRRENFGEGFLNICEALLELSKRNDVQIIYPVHLNPNVHGPVHRLLGSNPRIQLVEPQDYLPFIYLMDQSYLLLTDSGGIQEEAPSLGKPVLVMRENTERPEAVSSGTVKLVGVNKQRIVDETMRLLDDGNSYSRMCNANNPYGDGEAAQRIVNFLINESK